MPAPVSGTCRHGAEASAGQPSLPPRPTSSDADLRSWFPASMRQRLVASINAREILSPIRFDHSPVSEPGPTRREGYVSGRFQYWRFVRQSRPLHEERTDDRSRTWSAKQISLCFGVAFLPEISYLLLSFDTFRNRSYPEADANVGNRAYDRQSISSS